MIIISYYSTISVKPLSAFFLKVTYFHSQIYTSQSKVKTMNFSIVSTLTLDRK